MSLPPISRSAAAARKLIPAQASTPDRRQADERNENRAPPAPSSERQKEDSLDVVGVVCDEGALKANGGVLRVRIPLRSECLLCEGRGVLGSERICTACVGKGTRLRHSIEQGLIREPCAPCGASGKLPPPTCPVCRGRTVQEEIRSVDLKIGTLSPGSYEIPFQVPGLRYPVKLQLTVQPAGRVPKETGSRSWIA